MKRWICLFAILAMAASAVHSWKKTRKADAKTLVGLTVDEALKKVHVPPDKCVIFDEPPLIGRGVSGAVDDRTRLELWISRRDGVFNEKRAWTFDQIKDKRVTEASYFIPDD